MNKRGHFLLGAGLGIGIGMLFAPKSGKENREALSKKVKELVEKAKEIDVEEVKNAIIIKAQEFERTLKELDKETAKQLIIDKSNELKIKAQELFDVAVEKGTPVVQKAAKEIKEKTAIVLRNTADKIDVHETKTTRKKQKAIKE